MNVGFCFDATSLSGGVAGKARLVFNDATSLSGYLAGNKK